MSVPELKLAFITQPEVSPSGSHCTTMAPKYNVRKTSSVAVKEENIFPAVSSEAGRPKETTTETPDEETEQPNVLALEEAHREREQPSPCSSERQKRKDPPPVSKDVTVDPTEAKRRRVNWSKGDNRAKLQASLLKWRNLGFLDENGRVLSMTMTEFANIEGIPPRTFCTYASGKRAGGAHVGTRRKSAVSKTANLKATVHRERVERLKTNLVGITVDTAGPSSLSSSISTVDRIIVQNPTDQAETSNPAETVMASSVPNLDLNRTFTVRRKAAKRSESWYHKPPLQNDTAPLLPSPEAEVILAKKKKQRLEEPLPTTTDEAARKTDSPDVSAGHPPAAADDGANADLVTDTQPNAGATRASRRWAPEEDTKLTSAVTNTHKKKWGKEYKTDWVAIAALVPGRTRGQCLGRWRESLDRSINCANGHTSKWTADEDSKLKGAVQAHGGKDWAAIALLVPGRTQKQCNSRWRDTLDPSIDYANRHTGIWTADEVKKLKDAVQTRGGKSWVEIAALVPGRTDKQRRNFCFRKTDSQRV
jgi:hypothetical protein